MKLTIALRQPKRSTDLFQSVEIDAYKEIDSLGPRKMMPTNLKSHLKLSLKDLTLH